MKRSFRKRPVDVNRAMPIRREAFCGDTLWETVDGETATAALRHEEIPIPVISEVPVPPPAEPFSLPKHYLHFIPSKVPPFVAYTADEEDMEFLGRRGLPLGHFEELMERLERLDREHRDRLAMQERARVMDSKDASSGAREKDKGKKSCKSKGRRGRPPKNARREQKMELSKELVPYSEVKRSLATRENSSILMHVYYHWQQKRLSRTSKRPEEQKMYPAGRPLMEDFTINPVFDPTGDPLVPFRERAPQDWDRRRKKSEGPDADQLSRATLRDSLVTARWLLREICDREEVKQKLVASRIRHAKATLCTALSGRGCDRAAGVKRLSSECVADGVLRFTRKRPKLSDFATRVLEEFEEQICADNDTELVISALEWRAPVFAFRTQVQTLRRNVHAHIGRGGRLRFFMPRLGTPTLRPTSSSCAAMEVEAEEEEEEEEEGVGGATVQIDCES